MDRLTGEIDCTGLVESWDRECSDGGETLDPTHVAWEVAVDVAAQFAEEPREPVCSYPFGDAKAHAPRSAS